MTRRDQSVIGGLLLALAGLATVIGWPALAPASSTGLAASPSPSLAAARPYREGLLGIPTSVSPFGARSTADRALVALTFSGLVRLGPDGMLVPDLAERWTVDPTGASYTFTLRANAVWQDGQPLTSHDVVYTIGVLQDPAYTGPGASSWRDVTVSAPDPRTVRFDLSTPIAGFLYAATQPIAPAHLLEGVPIEDLTGGAFGERPIGSGPYRLLSWNAGSATLEAATFVASADGPGPATSVDSLATPAPSAVPARVVPYITRIEFRFSGDPTTLVDAYRAGQLDAVSGLPPDVAAGLGAASGSRLLRYPRSTLTAVVLNLRAGRTQFRDARARRGLLEAIDRDTLVADELAGLATRADAPIPPTSWAFDPAKSVPVAHDLAAAAKDLAAGGWTRTKAGWAAPGQKAVTTVELICPDGSTSPTGWAVANAVAADWRALGLDIRVVGLPPAELVDKRLGAGQFDVALLDITLGHDPDLYPLLASTQTIAGGSNVSGLQDPTLDAKLIAARKPGPDDARRAAYADLQAYLAANEFLLPLAYRDEVVVVRDTLQGPSVREVGDAADRFYDVLTWRLADDR